MRLVIRVSDKVYRDHIQVDANEGNLPLAWLLHGHIVGHGWGFLRPWAQQAIFPLKGSYGGIDHPDRKHEPFWILRLWPRRTVATHKNQIWAIEGRYWWGLVWRKSWGKRRGIWRARWAFLDPDIISKDHQPSWSG